MKKIVRNAAYCIICEDEIESIHRHDFKYCKCGAIAVDGGKDYLKRTGELKNCKDISEFVKCEDCGTYIEYISQYHDPEHILIKEKQAILKNKLDKCSTETEKRNIKWSFHISGWWCPTCKKEK